MLVTFGTDSRISGTGTIKMPRKKTVSNRDRGTLKCKYCEYTTSRKAFMDDHMRIHTGDRPYRCEVCGKGFTQKSNLTKHQIVHGSGYKNEYKCDKCDFVTRYKQSLKMHANWHDGVKPYACKLCDRTFSQSTHRRTHMKEAHGDERKFQCHFCSKCFKRKEHLDKHIAFHKNERNYACDICGKKFIEEKHVLNHMLIHGGDETKKFQCDLCPYKSRYKQGLQVHYRIHLGIRPYKCEDCPKAFRTSQTLRIHRCMVHQGLMGKKFQCDHCDYRSANKQSLKKHIDHVHIGIKKEGKQYPCLCCGNIYMSHASLHGHKRKKHPLKLRQEMQAKLQLRLSMVRCNEHSDSDSKFDANLAVADYRFKNPLHQTLKEQLLKRRARKNSVANKNPKRRKKNAKSSSSPVSEVSKQSDISYESTLKIRKVCVNSPRGRSSSNEKNAKVHKSPQNNGSMERTNTLKTSPVTPPKTGPETSATKQPVHDLLQERIAKKNKQSSSTKPNAAVALDFRSPTNVKKGSTAVNSKVVYMTELGLLRRSATDPVEVCDTGNNETDTEAIVPIGTIRIQSCGDEVDSNVSDPDIINPSHNEDKTNTSLKKPPNTSKFPKIKPLRCSPRKTNPRKFVSPKKSSSPRKAVLKTGPNSHSPWQPPPIQERPSSIVVYEAVDVPSLGPYNNQLHTSSPVMSEAAESGSILSSCEIKDEPQDAPINYSMKEYDSLRALATVFLTNKNQ